MSGYFSNPTLIAAATGTTGSMSMAMHGLFAQAAVAEREGQ